MADTLFLIPASALIGDNDAQLVGGDKSATHENHKGRPALAFDATDEEAAISAEYICPETYGGGTLKCDIVIAAADDNSNGCVFDIFVEAKTPSADTIDMEAATGWDTANSSGDIDLNGTTVGDPIVDTITLTNKDSLAAGDLVRFGIRRDTDHANDDASGKVFVYSLRIYEDA